MQRTYQDMFPDNNFNHLERTVEQYFSNETPLWWVDFLGDKVAETPVPNPTPLPPVSWASPASPTPIACLWVGNAIDQVEGKRLAHIFLLYVVPEHRRKGIGTALMQYVEDWARKRGDLQIGLQVFPSNKAAMNLYYNLGFHTQSLWMIKSIEAEQE
ncbi:MAG: GNAT family N-acetyltransferase [Nostocaceae cyanobacterium]|nr:GNAT family N-acetyltransferase [Nostocaceae cyanobacterium]